MYHNKGFHLIEILIAMSLMMIISHFVLGRYQSLVVIEKRRAAEAALLQLGAQLEEYAMDKMTYEGATLAKLHIEEFAAKRSYRITIDVLNAHEYLLSARPLLQQAVTDKSCGVLSLSSTGVKYISGASTVISCWQS